MIFAYCPNCIKITGMIVIDNINIQCIECKNIVGSTI